MKLTPFIQTGKTYFTRTRDVKIPIGPPRFPVKDIMRKNHPEVLWSFRLPCEQEAEPSEEVLPDNTSRCATCELFVCSSSILCEACNVNAGPNKRLKRKVETVLHNNTPGCKFYEVEW